MQGAYDDAVGAICLWELVGKARMLPRAASASRKRGGIDASAASGSPPAGCGASEPQRGGLRTHAGVVPPVRAPLRGSPDFGDRRFGSGCRPGLRTQVTGGAAQVKPREHRKQPVRVPAPTLRPHGEYRQAVVGTASAVEELTAAPSP